MSASVAINNTVSLRIPSLTALFAKTGGKLPEGDKASVIYLCPVYAVQAAAIVDRFIL